MVSKLITTFREGDNDTKQNINRLYCQVLDQFNTHYRSYLIPVKLIIKMIIQYTLLTQSQEEIFCNIKILSKFVIGQTTSIYSNDEFLRVVYNAFAYCSNNLNLQESRTTLFFIFNMIAGISSNNNPLYTDQICKHSFIQMFPLILTSNHTDLIIQCYYTICNISVGTDEQRQYLL